MMKPNADVDVEVYGKEQTIHDPGSTFKEFMGNNESLVQVDIGNPNKENKSMTGPDTTKNDVSAIVSEDQTAIVNSVQVDQREDASVSHPRNHHTNNRHNRLQPYSTMTSTTTETYDASEEVETTSEEIENDQVREQFNRVV
ncbi:unnamed protein product [Orchesella dallaii]|uniref:Uncharacterized protein n=1 Tax=Orchesella dallaii TaxID=48710 RepID=A0ABP1PZI6_9HEXA